MYNIDEIQKAIAAYVDQEVMPSLPTHAKWLVGTYVVSMNLDSSKIHKLLSNPVLSPLDIEKDGMYDLDTLLDNLEQNAEKYGKMELSLPIVGTMKFGSEDIHKLHELLKGEK